MGHYWFKVAALGVMALLVFLAAHSVERTQGGQKQLYASDFRGNAAPPFYVQEWITAEPDRRGKVVLIDFWATWCPPCREAIGELNGYQKEFKDKLVVIGVSNESADTVRDFMRDNEMDYSVAVDPSARMAGALNITAIPHVMIVSSDGIVRWQGNPLDPADELTDKTISRIIQADPAAGASGPHLPPPSRAPAS